MTLHPHLAPPDASWVDRVAELVGRAAANGVSTEPLRAALRVAVSRPDVVDRAVLEVDRDPGRGTAGLRDTLLDTELSSHPRLTEAVGELERQVRLVTGRVVVGTDATGPVPVTWLHPRAPYERPFTGRPDRGRVVLLKAGAAQVGDQNTQVNVFVHELAGPRVDLATFVREPRVSTALAAASLAPDDPAARRQVHDVVAQLQPRSSDDWTAEFAARGSVRSGAGAAHLDGTVAVIESRNVQIGDRSYQENRIVHSISPTIRAAELLAHDPDLVDALIDFASSRGDGAATARFREAVEHVLLTTMAEAPATTSGHGSVHRAPAAGRTLQIRGAEGVSVGARVSQKNHHVQRAGLDRAFDRGTRRARRTTQRVQRRMGAPDVR